MSEEVKDSFFDIEKPSEDEFTRAKQSLYYNPQTQAQFCTIMDWHIHELKQARAEVIEEVLRFVSTVYECEDCYNLEDIKNFLTKLSEMEK